MKILIKLFNKIFCPACYSTNIKHIASSVDMDEYQCKDCGWKFMKY